MASTILVVDDDRHLAGILGKALTGEGYEIQVAHDGDEALVRLREEPPDLAVLDVLLPRRDGFSVLTELRSMENPGEQIPVLMMTGCRVTPEYQDRADALGAAALLAKPVPLESLYEQIRLHLKAAPPRAKPKPAAGARRKTDAKVASKKRKSVGKKAAATRTATKAGKRKAAGTSADGLKGRFSDIAFPHLLHHLHGLRATGVLILANGRKKKAIQLRDGYPAAVKSNLVGECLGNLLMQSGALSEHDMQESIGRVKQGEGLQGEILVAMELLTEDAVVEALRQQAEEKLFEIFEWNRGSYQFQIGGRLKRGNELALEASPASLIFRGVRDRVAVEPIDEFLRSNSDRFVIRSESEFYRFQDIDLGDFGERLVASLDGSQQLGDFVSADPPVRRMLYSLAATEMIDLRAARTAGAVGQSADGAQLEGLEPATNEKPLRSDSQEERALRSELAAMAERLRKQSYFEMLGVGEAASADDVEAAFEAWARRTHPDKYASASSSVKQLADEVHQILVQAHETLIDPKKKQAYLVERKRGREKAAEREEGKKALEAEIAFQKGEAHVRTRDYELALMDFGRALQTFPEEGEYHAYYGWCLHLCHPDDVSIAQEAIEHVKRGVKLARDREKPYLFLGRLYKVVGKSATAEKMFTRAVQIRPDCVEALRELRLINLRRRKNKGLVRRILRR